MEYLRNTWYLATWSEDLKPGELKARVILNRPLVLFRGQDDHVVAMDDRCPHRAVPLSLGKLRQGRLVCGYHGLEFDESGTCVRNPHPSGKIPAAARVKTYVVVERHSAAWIWMGDKALADPDLIPDFAKLDASATDYNVTRRDHLVMDVPFDLIVDNLLDCSHTSFVHEGVLGNEEMIQAPTEIKQTGNTLNVIRMARNCTPPGMFDMIFRNDGAPVDIWTDFRWNAPSCLLLDVGVAPPGGAREEGTGYFGVHILTPETDTSTHYFTAACRWNIQAGSETPEMRLKISDLRKFAFEEQDEPIIRAQHRILSMTPPEEIRPVMLETDLGVVRWRRIMAQLAEREVPVRTTPAHADQPRALVAGE